MEKFIDKKLKVIGKTHPHFGEVVMGDRMDKYKEEDVLVCITKKGQSFFVFDETDVELIK